MIHFLQPLNTQKLRMAYNNDIIRFYSDNAQSAVSCTITDVFNAINVTLYPNPQGQFYFNFKPHISALVNRDNFNDTQETNIQGNQPASFVYNTYANHSIFTQRSVTFTITFDDDNTETATYVLAWLAGVQQTGNNHNFSLNDLVVQAPFKKDTTNSYSLKYWQGYPFDIPFFTTGNEVRLTNNTNLLQTDFDIAGYGDRLFVSDGRTDVSLEDVLPLAEGFNELTFSVRSSGGRAGSAQEKYIILEKIPYTCGVYLKWYNALGGYSYWLFENTYSLDRRTKHIGEIARDNNNLEDSFGRSVTLGKESQDTIRIIAELLNEDERAIIENLMDSPKVYLFTGTPFSQNSYQNWIEVSLKTSSARLKNPRQPLTNLTFDLELPQRYTQTL